MKVNGYFILDGEVQSLHITDLKRGLNYEKFERARPHGEWITKGSVGNGTWCTVCDTNIKLFPNRYSFCPNCGADMRKGGE